MTDKPALPQPNIRLQRTALAARLLAILKSSDDFEWACQMLEQSNGGRIVLHLSHDNKLVAIGHEGVRKVG